MPAVHRLPLQTHRWDLLALGMVALLASFIRWSRMATLDIFEDGYHHWWIGAHWVETGVYLDPMSRMTDGSWLPGYYPLSGLAFAIDGWRGLADLRWVSLFGSLATLALVFAMASPKGLLAASTASLFYALAIQDILIGSMALPESILVLCVALGVYLLFFTRWPAERARLALASLLFLGAMALRYEAWLVLAILPLYVWWRRPEILRELAWVITPCMIFGLAWFASMMPHGLLPATVFGQTAREAQNQIALGNVPGTPWDRWWRFWYGNYATGLIPMFILGPVYMVLRRRHDYGTWVSFGLFLGASTLVAAGLGTGSYRYLAIAVPFIAVAAGMAVASLLAPLRRMAGRAAPFAATAIVAVLVISAAMNTAWISKRIDGVAQLQEPLRRAGVWISDQPWPSGKRLLSDSPTSTYYSGVDPAMVWSSWWLPSNRTEALSVLRTQYAFIVFVNVSYYPLVTLFPELKGGGSTLDFTLVYNPNSWELQYGAKQVFVYAPRV